MDDAIATNNRVPIDRYYEVAGGGYVPALLQFAQNRRAGGYKVIGHVKVSHIKAGRVLLKKKNATAVVTSCLDVRKVKTIDKKGHSVVAKNRPDFYKETLTVTNKKYPARAGWLVTDGRDKGATKCGA